MLILGSKSPRRKEILEMANIPFKVFKKDIDEDINESDPYLYAKLTALKKGQVISNEFRNDVVLCCDTIVCLDNEILEKPVDKDDCYKMISKLSGNKHVVITGVYIGSSNKYYNFYVSTEVYVDKLTDREIIDYVNTKEPYDKAGGYAIQGLFSKHISKIIGDYYNVMGLPLNSIYTYLKEFHII